MSKPRKIRRTGEPALSRDARRLLLALAAAGASPARADLRQGFLVVSGPRAGITTILANAPLAAGEELAVSALADWSGADVARLLVLTSEGAAKARRLTAPDDLDAFAAQHRSLSRVSIAPGEAPVLIDAAESPLSWLARRKGRDGSAFLAPAQVEAGARFGRDVVAAQITPRVTADWSRVGSSSGRGPRSMNVSDLAIAARQRLDRVAAAVGPDLNNLLIDVCGFQKGLELVERERLWPQRTAKVVLRIALDRLAAHYGLASVAHGPEGAKTRRWGSDDYRPSIDPRG